MTIVEQVDVDSKYPYKLNLFYTKIDGILVGTEVSVLGRKAGLVESFEPISAARVEDKRFLQPGKKKAIKVTIRLAFPLTLWDNYHISFKSKTVFSGRTIDIDPGFFRKQTNREHLYIAPVYRDKPEFAVARYYDDFFTGATALMYENRLDLRQSIVHLRSLTGKINRGSGTLPMLVNEQKLYCQLQDTTEDIAIIAREARWYAEGIHEENKNLSPFTGSIIMNVLGLNLIF